MLAHPFQRVLVAFGLAAVLLGGCAAPRTTGWSEWDPLTPSQLSSSEKQSLSQEAQRAFAGRGDRASLLKAIEIYENLASAERHEVQWFVQLARSYYLLADIHTEVPEEKYKLWETGARWGERGLATQPDFRRRVASENVDFEEALSSVTAREAPAAYWTASCLGKWARGAGIGTMLKYRGRIKKMIETVEKLTPDYFYGAVERYWGAYYAVAPGFAGGSLEKSQAYFTKAFEAEKARGKDKMVLSTHVLYADTYAVKKGDRAIFESTLKKVLAADPRAIPEIEPEQRAEQVKAQSLLNRIEELF